MKKDAAGLVGEFHFLTLDDDSDDTPPTQKKKKGKTVAVQTTTQAARRHFGIEGTSPREP